MCTNAGEGRRDSRKRKKKNRKNNFLLFCLFKNIFSVARIYNHHSINNFFTPSKSGRKLAWNHGDKEEMIPFQKQQFFANTCPQQKKSSWTISLSLTNDTSFNKHFKVVNSLLTKIPTFLFQSMNFKCGDFILFPSSLHLDKWARNKPKASDSSLLRLWWLNTSCKYSCQSIQSLFYQIMSHVTIVCKQVTSISNQK